MPESKEKNPVQIETPGLSNILKDAQQEFVSKDLNALEKRMNFSRALESVKLNELPDKNSLKNFEGFQWEVVHLAAYCMGKLNIPATEMKKLPADIVNKSTLPSQLQLIYTKILELGKIQNISPVYGKVFENWSANIDTYIAPHTSQILKVYKEDSVLDMLPPTLKSINPISGAALGGGLAVLYWAYKKFSGENDNSSFGLGKMLGMVFGGAMIGMLPAGKNLYSSFSNITKHLGGNSVTDWFTSSGRLNMAKNMVEMSQKSSSAMAETTAKQTEKTVSSKAPTQKEIYTKILNPKGISLDKLTAEQAYTSTRNIFGNGQGASALILLDQKFGGTGELVKREMALAAHEGGFNWFRKNADPKSGHNTGTFQIGGAGTTPQESLSIYNGKVTAGIKYYEKISGTSVSESNLTDADRDVFSHIGHLLERESIFSTKNKSYIAWLQKNPDWKNKPGSIFAMLCDKSLSDDNVQTLMSTIIQGGIDAIGKDVVKKTRKGDMKIAEKYTKEVGIA